MKTYVDRPEADWAQRLAINMLGMGLYAAEHHEDALTVQEAELSMLRRVGGSERSMLVAQANLSNTYEQLRRFEPALSMQRDVYFGFLKLYGKESEDTLIAANNYASFLNLLKRFEEAKSLVRKTMPVARRFLGEENEHTLKMRWIYAGALYKDPAATLDDLRKAVTMLEDTSRIAQRLLGAAHPTTTGIERDLRDARAVLHARETPPTSG